MKNLLFFTLLLTLFSCQQEEDASIVNKWKVSGYVKNNNSITQSAPSAIYLTFKKDKSVSINLEINSCSGSYDIEKKELKLEGFACTEACCDSEFSMELLSLLSSVNAYSSQGNELNLMGDNQMNIRLNVAE